MTVLDNFKHQLRASAAWQFYSALGDRDRLAVVGLAAFLALVLIYLAIWRPVSEWRDGANSRYQQQLGVLEWMRTHEADARAAARTAATERSGNDSMLSVVSSTANRAGVKLTRFQPESGGGVSVVIQNQPFNAVLRWIDDLASERIRVRTLSIDRQGQSGLVNGRINLI